MQVARAKILDTNSKSGKTRQRSDRGCPGQERRVEGIDWDEPPGSLSGAGTFHMLLWGVCGAHTWEINPTGTMVCTKHEHTGN